MSTTRSPGGTGKAAGSFGALLLLALIAISFAPARALAQLHGTGAGSGTGMTLPSGGWYGGLSPGRSLIGIRDSMLPLTGATLSNLSQNESVSGYKLYGGYRFTRNLSLEGGYVDFGRFDTRREIAAPAFGSLSSNSRDGGFYLGAVGVVPLPNRFSLFGKLGTGYSSGAASASTSAAMLPLLTPTDLRLKRSEWNSKFGLGASYEMSNKLGLRFEYERINSFGEGRIGEGNIGVWSLGLTKRY